MSNVNFRKVSVKGIVLLLGFVSAVAFADSRRVGNGGGFAEMLTLVADKQLALQFETCLAHSDSCPLVESSKEFAKELLVNLPELQRVPLKFSSLCLEQINVTPEYVEIPSCMLYRVDTANPEPLPAPELYLMALRARLTQANVAVEPNLEALKPVFLELDREDQATALPLAGGSVILHFLKLKRGYYIAERFLLVETPADTYDLTSDFLPKLGCEVPAKDLEIRVESSVELPGNKALFTGEARWGCIQRNYRANFKVQAELNSDLELGALKIQITRKEEVQ